MSDYYVPAATVEEDFVNLVRLELTDIRNTFFKIGFRLSEANRCKYYKKLGFNTIEECAEALFGFKKTTTYDLMNVANSFGDRKAPMMIDSKYQGFNQSQLVLFSSINYARAGFISRARPEDSIEKLKKAKRYWKKFQIGKYCSITYSGTKTIDDIIELYESKLALPAASSTSNDIVEHADHQENFSGYPEKNDDEEISEYSENESTKKIVLYIPENKVSEVVEEVIDDVPVEDKIERHAVNQKELLKNIFDYAGKRLDLLDYKTIFDPEHKGLGVRVPSDDIVRCVLRQSFNYLGDHRVDIKKLLREHLSEQIGRFDYQIMLCGRKQGLSPFFSNVSDYVIDFLLELFSPTLEEKKK